MDGEEDVEAQAEAFQKSCRWNRSSSSSEIFAQKLENSKTSAFKRTQEELRSRNVLELEPVVQLLARITEDVSLRKFLRLHMILSKKPLVPKATTGLPNDGQHLTVATSRTMPNLSLASSANQQVNCSAVESARTVKESTACETSRVSSHLVTASKSKTAKRKNRAFDRKNWDFLTFDYKVVEKIPVPSLAHMSLFEQENALVHDLLHTLVGIEGSYIRLHPHQGTGSKKNVLLVDDEADKLLKTLAEKIITICPLYSSVIHFVDDNDNGLVNQALAAAMRSVLKDYFNMVAQLESHFRKGNLTMQTVWYYLQSWIANMGVMKHCSSCISMNRVSGGAVLSILHNKTVSFKAHSKLLDFCYTVTRDSCVPYFQILDRWMTEGRIDDPYREFFIEDVSTSDAVADNNDDDSFWNSRYRLNVSKMPVFLSAYQDKILKTGKYLSVIREYGKELESLLPEDCLTYSVEEKDYSSRIESAYQSASRQLLGLLLNDADLLGHLQSVKHYFLMDEGDFMVQFMDMAEDELQKCVEDTNPTRLNSLLELAIKTSTLRSDAHHEKVSISLMQDSLFKQLSSIISKGRRNEVTFQETDSLKGFEAVVLEYDVKWPLNLILSERSLTCYQILFRHLFLCDYVERQLLSVWMDNRTARTYALKAVTGYSEAFALRQKMLLFLHNRNFFMLIAVVEPHYRAFVSKVKNLSQVDELAFEHSHFIDACLRDCMLSHEFALQFMVKLLQLCLSFAEFMRVRLFVAPPASPLTLSLIIQESHKLSMPYELQKFSPEVPSVRDQQFGQKSEFTGFEEQVRHFHDEFNFTLTKFLHEIATQEQDHFSGNVLHIIYRLVPIFAGRSPSHSLSCLSGWTLTNSTLE